MSVRWLAESIEEGELAARVGRDGDRLVADWIGRARLSVKSDGSDAVFEPHPEGDPRDAEKLRRGTARLLLAHLEGKIPLHASAVAIDGRAIVFVGGSTLGKSTLAAALCEHAGASLLGDDAVVIEGSAGSYRVNALEDRHWLDAASARALGRPDEFSDKVPLEPRRVDTTSASLAAIVHLEFSGAVEQPHLVPVAGLEAVAGLLSQLTRFVIDDPAIAKRDLAALAELVDHTRIARLERPRRLDLLQQTALAVAAYAKGKTS